MKCKEILRQISYGISPMYETTYIENFPFKNTRENPRPLHQLTHTALYYCTVLTTIVFDTKALKKKKRKTKPCKPSGNKITKSKP